MVMAAATLVAGALDYLFNVLTGRWLAPVEFGALVSVTAILQVMVHLTNVIRNVVAHYTAGFTAEADGVGRIAPFVWRMWRWSWRWGLVATAVMALLALPVAGVLRLASAWPLWAASLALLLLFLRPVTDGALQGMQRFGGLGAVQVLQALLRLLLAAVLIRAGLAATGAILALPLASAVALVLAFAFLWPALKGFGAPGAIPAVSWGYSLQTLAGLIAFALLTNMDAVVVKLFFDPETAGHYGPVVTLGKMNIFVPLAMGMVLFPKATQRQAAGRRTRPILLLALAVTVLPGALLTSLYFAAPGPIVRLVFGTAYADPGEVLGMVGLATTLFAALNIWLNYALSLRRRAFVVALAVTALVQLAAMLLFHRQLADIATAMVAAGLLGNLAAVATVRGAGAQSP
jgi:O-antigen/teichoic acid export membrane protein